MAGSGVVGRQAQARHRAQELVGVDVGADRADGGRSVEGYAGTETVEEGAREAVRVALLGADGPTGTFTRWENETIPW